MERNSPKLEEPIFQAVIKHKQDRRYWNSTVPDSCHKNNAGEVTFQFYLYPDLPQKSFRPKFQVILSIPVELTTYLNMFTNFAAKSFSFFQEIWNLISIRCNFQMSATLPRAFVNRNIFFYFYYYFCYFRCYYSLILPCFCWYLQTYFYQNCWSSFLQKITPIVHKLTLPILILDEERKLT